MYAIGKPYRVYSALLIYIQIKFSLQSSVIVQNAACQISEGVNLWFSPCQRTVFRPLRSVSQPIIGRAPGWSGPCDINNKWLTTMDIAAEYTEQIKS